MKFSNAALGWAVVLVATLPAEAAEDRRTELSFSAPFVLKHFDTIPEPGTKNRIHAPYLIEMSHRADGESGRHWLNLHVGAARGLDGYLAGGGGGIIFGGGGFRMDVGILYEEQILANGGDLSDTFLDNSRVIALARARTPLPIGTGGVEVRAYWQFDTTVANREGQDTIASYSMGWVIRPYAEMNLGVLKARAEAGVHLLPRTVIASNDFAADLGGGTVFRPLAGAGVALGALEVWAKYALVTGVDDSVEHFYRAPHYVNDYLMARQTAFVEVKWVY